MKKIISLIIIFITIISLTTVSLAVVRARSSSSVKSSSSTSYSGVKSISGYKTFTPKYNTSNIKTQKVNDNPTYYKNYSSTNTFTPNAWTAMWAFQCIHDGTEQVTEQDIAKELEERGYTQEEVDEILKEGRMAQEEDKQVKEKNEKIFNYILIGFGIIVLILIIVGIIAFFKI